MGNLKFLLLGAWFGMVLTKAQVISWYKIRNMFFFREPDLYLIIGSAVVVGAASVFLIKRFRLRTVSGEALRIPGKTLTRGTVIGGFIFGLGWFITGTCPGPIYAQLGSGELWAGFTLAGALAGAYAYARLRPKIGD
ncbi:MAG: transporter [Fibrobacteres bacterium]|nr:transporter [Fibrobacterota bacterium]